MNNISICENNIRANAQGVVSTLLAGRHNQNSKTDVRIKAIYTEKTILSMSKNLFDALNNRRCYISVSNLSQINSKANVDLKSCEELKNFCIKLFTDDFRRKSNKLYSNLKLSKDICQFCHGRSTNALDHYFDKKDAYELAIFPDNLIPICTDCNSAKGTKSFVYPYLLILQNPNWLKCTVNADKKFRFSITKQVAKNDFEKNVLKDLQKQFSSLKIFDYYVISGQALVIEQISIISKMKCLGYEESCAKKFFECITMETKKAYLKSTEFYKFAILKGIIKDFDTIWNKL